MAKSKANLELHYRIIRSPILTEKVMNPAGPQERDDKGKKTGEARPQYGFWVERGANKIQIRNAVEAIFDVEVEKVRTLRVKGKYHRAGWRYKLEPAQKKAIVTLRAGHAIDLF